ncbi:MAG: OsmC family protein [Candidatus Phytoplasma vitis]|nr:MAG: OsmC family protein [Candidatus Phytoplasma vitis]
MNELKIIAYYEEKFKDLGIIKNGLKTKLVSALMNSEEDYSQPNELLSLSLIYCFYKTIKAITSIRKKDVAGKIKVKILCNTLKDEKGVYFKIDLFCGIQNLSITEIKELIDLTHQKCPVSRMFDTYPHFSLKPISFEEI